MKKYIFITAIAWCLIGQNTMAQSTLADNTFITSNEFIGWDNTFGGPPVRFRHELNNVNSRFEWYTTDGGGTTEKMKLTQAGRLGIGISTPNEILHLHMPNSTYLLTTNSTTGFGANDGFCIGSLNSDAVLLQREDANIDFYTNSLFRMRLTGGTTPGRLGLGLLLPQNCVHFHDPTNYNFLQITNSSSGSDDSNDGLRIGLNNLIGELRLNTTSEFDIYQNGARRLRFDNLDWTGLLGASQLNAPRLMISLDGTVGAIPSSMLHLGEFPENGTTNADRNWMNIGVTMTTGVGNSSGDIMYVGLLERPLFENSENTSSVIAWGCNENATTGFGPDFLRFIFITNDQSQGTIAAQSQGREVARFEPFGNFGIGNFHNDGTDEVPTQRLDVKGNARFRLIPDNTDNVLVTGTTNAAGDYTLSRIDFGTNPHQYLANDATWQCTWEKVSSSFVTGYAGSCMEKNVGIGTNNPIAKLEVVNTLTSSGNSFVLTSTGVNGSGHTGAFFRTTGGNTACNSVVANMQANSNANQPLGVGSDRLIGTSTSAHTMSGGNFSGYEFIYALSATVTADDALNGDVYAAYFGGSTFSTGQYLPSDEQLKTDIAPCESVMDDVMSVDIFSYNYNTEEFPILNLPTGAQTGYTAQNIGENFPQLVNTATQPEVTDDEGNITSESFQFEVVNYTGMVPVLHKAIQEQQVQLDAVIAAFEAMGIEVKSLQSNSNPDFELNLTLENDDQPKLGLPSPNPNDGYLTIPVYIPAHSTAVVELLFTDALGQAIQVSEVTERGHGTVNINTTNLSSGTYQYTLIIDGNVEATRKMVRQ